MAVTLTSMTTNIRNNIDEPTASYWAATEVTNAVQKKQMDLFRRVFALKESWFLANSTALTLSSGTKTYALPADFYRMHVLRVSQNGQENVLFRWCDSAQQEFQDGWRSDIVIASPAEFLYDFQGNQTILISPTPQSSYTTDMWYFQIPTVVSSGTDTFGVLDPFTDFIEYAATAELLRKGPVGDVAGWEMKAAEAWQMTMQALATPRTDQTPDLVNGMYDVE